MGRQVRRVPVDFDWPLNKVWECFLQPAKFDETKCPDCEHGGSPRAEYLHKLWYGYVPFAPESTGSTRLTAATPAVRAFAERNVTNSPEFYGAGELSIVTEASRLARIWNGMWCHHLAQEDVDALIAAERLHEFTHAWSRENGWQKIDPPPTVTAAQVNTWSLRAGLGHDSINAWTVIGAACDREGVPHQCATCDGHGTLETYEGQRAEAEAWEPTEPPSGDAWQLWETVSEGSPISPVFPERDGLVAWLMSPAYSWGISTPLTREQAEAFVGAGWAPTMIGVGSDLRPGEQWVGDTTPKADA